MCKLGMGRRNKFLEYIISVPFPYYLCFSLKCKLVIALGEFEAKFLTGFFLI
ncbi:exotoxin, partial [Staphylococcus aureus]